MGERFIHTLDGRIMMWNSVEFMSVLVFDHVQQQRLAAFASNHRHSGLHTFANVTAGRIGSFFMRDERLIAFSDST